MHFDFVDIGTCDFDTCLDHISDLGSCTILLVEPLKHYLDKLPNHTNIVKENAGISNYNGEVDLYYLPENIIVKNDFGRWTKGCSSIGHKHPSIEILLQENNLPLDLIAVEKIKIITFSDLCEKHSIDSIGSLKIDTEGHEQYILPDVIAMIMKGFRIDKIKFEYPYLDKVLLDKFISELLNCNYRVVDQTRLDFILEK